MEKFDDQLYNDQQFKSRPKTVYQAYAQAVWEIFRPQSIIDLGCACGFALDWWQKQGVKIRGIEAAQAAFKYLPKNVKAYVKKLDLRNQLSLDKAEVVNFTEVAEHIDKKYEKTMLNNVLNSVGKYLIISWSNEANQEHVNPRSLKYVKKIINLFYEPELTENLKAKLKAITTYPHWHKNILVFSKIPPKQRILFRHYEWLDSYWNKNIGYFIATAEKTDYSVRRVTDRNDWQSLLKRWHRVWLYPFDKHLLFKLLILKLFGNKIILKMDSVIFPKWRARIIEKLCDYILVESITVAAPFANYKKLVYFSGGLSQKNIDLIKSLKVKRTKQILFCGRPTYQKGIDRFKKIKISGWKLKIASNLSPEKYYTEILKSALVVLPTRGEGWPNVFSDTFFCRRLFLTTDKAQCAEAIINQDFYVKDFNKGVAKIISNLEWYYQHYDEFYDATKFAVADKVFLSLIINKG